MIIIIWQFGEEVNAPTSRPETPLKGLKQRESSLRPASRPGTPVGNLPLNSKGEKLVTLIDRNFTSWITNARTPTTRKASTSSRQSNTHTATVPRLVCPYRALYTTLARGPFPVTFIATDRAY